MKLKLFVFIFSFFGAGSLSAQKGLCIIGTFHDERSFINADSLYNILRGIRPDVILVELDSVYFTSDFQFDLEEYPDLLSTNENISADRYRSDFGIELRPYEITRRNQYYRETQYFDNIDRVFSHLLGLRRDGKMDKAVAEDFSLVLYALDAHGPKYTSVRELNSDVTDKFFALRQQILYTKMVSVVENIPEMGEWIDFIREWAEFWDRRNEAMAENIREIAAVFPDKRLVVLTGIEHKHYLKKLLSTHMPVVEYWEY